MKLDALEHPKTYALASALNISRPLAIGHLELLWAFVGKHSPQGDIGKWPNGAIARACEWTGDADLFVDALIAVRLLDRDEVHRVSVHDWHEHAPGWVRAKVKDVGFVTNRPKQQGSPPSSPPGSTTGSPPGTGPSILEKGKEEKGSEGKRTLRAREADPHAVTQAIQGEYPNGTYGKQNWVLAERCIAKLLDEGESPADLATSARLYADQQRAKGSIGTQFIRSPEKFFGDGFWRGPFPLPATKAQITQDANIAASHEWLARSSGNA